MRKRKPTAYEVVFSSLLKEMGIKYVFNTQIAGKRVSFYLPQYKVVVNFSTNNNTIPSKLLDMDGDFWLKGIKALRYKIQELENIDKIKLNLSNYLSSHQTHYSSNEKSVKNNVISETRLKSADMANKEQRVL